VRELWRVLARHRDFRLLVSAGLISLTGDFILFVGVAYFVYDLTGSTLASAGTMLSLFLPSILLSSIAGVFVDRWNRVTTMVASNCLHAVGLLPLLLVDDPDRVWIVYAVSAWEGTVRLFFTPAEQAMVPRLVPDDDLVVANALNGQIRDVARLVGGAAGGVVVATGGITALALADMATFVASALLIAVIKTSGAVESPADLTKTTDGPSSSTAIDVTPSRVRTLVAQWRDGLRLAASEVGLRAVFVYTFIAMVGEGVMGTLFVPFFRDVLHGGGQAYGVVVAVQAIGGIVGGVVAASIGHRFSPALMFGVGGFLFGLVDLVMFLYPLAYVAVWPAAVCMIVVGVPGAIAMAAYNTLLQRGAPDAYRGRVYGALGVVQGVSILTGTVAAGFLGESVGIIPILSVQGIGGMVAGVMVLMILRDYSSPRSAPPPGQVRVENPVDL
jgi:predicted MFS family arabinose efflux permease